VICSSIQLLALSDASEVLQSSVACNQISLEVVISILALTIMLLIMALFRVKRHLSTQNQALSLLQTLLQQMPTGVLLLTPNSQVILSNALAEEILGWKDKSNTDPRVFEFDCDVILENGTSDAGTLLPTEQAITTKQPVQNVVIGLKSQTLPSQPHLDSLLSSTTESIRWLLMSATPMLSKDGTVEQIICTLSDISDQKQAEIECRQTQLFLHSILETMPIGLFVKNAQNLKFIFWNQASQKILGYHPQEIIGKPAQYCFPKKEADFLMANDQEVLENGQLINFSAELIQTSRRGLRLLQTHRLSILNEAGQPQYLLGTLEDITENQPTNRERWTESIQELSKQHQRSKLLAEITLKIRQSLQIEAILQTTVTEVQNLLEIDRVLIYRFTSDWSGTVVTEAVLPAYPAILGEKIEDPCFREKYIEQYAKGRVRFIPDLENSDLQPCHIETLQRFAVKANLVVPILQRENLWGLLIAHHCRDTRQWSEFEIELLQQLANQLSIALAQAELLEQETQQRQQLAKQNMTLEQAFKKLQQAQSQLVQSEKMVSLGQMVAGVAHEINNPVTFISGNLIPAHQYVNNLLQLLQLYEQSYPQVNPEIQEAVQDLDIEFIKEDLPKLLASMQMGADRIRKIVLSLRNFSRLDEAEKKRVDIHEGIDSTLLILQHRLKAVAQKPSIQVIKNYGILPPVECYAGQLNQVFMNILSNAVDAVENVPTPLITITTSIVTHHCDNHSNNNGNSSTDPSYVMSHNPFVVIQIEDNGAGMNEQIQSRLFDPFFTTKPPGKGTGLGLSISYQIIVEKHGGRLSCISTPGQGSAFILEIPIRQSMIVSKGTAGSA
jgi:PAS domain S-box-containing protein